MLDKYYSGPVSFDVLDLKQQIQRIKSLLEIIKKNSFGRPKSSVDEGLVDDVLSSVEVEATDGLSPDGDMLDDTANPTQPKQQKQQFEDEREPMEKEKAFHCIEPSFSFSYHCLHTPLCQLYSTDQEYEFSYFVYSQCSNQNILA